MTIYLDGGQWRPMVVGETGGGGVGDVQKVKDTKILVESPSFAMNLLLGKFIKKGNCLNNKK